MIDVYSIMYNEEFILPYFLRHYETFADRIFIVDDHSTDRTKEIAQAHPKVTVIDYEHEGLKEGEFSRTFEKLYKEHSRGVADWAICVDADEFVYHRHGVATKLKQLRAKGKQFIKVNGYTMLSKDLPKGDGQIYEECPMGRRTSTFDKKVIFDPTLDITFGDGRHSVESPVQPIRARILLLHYKYLSRDYFIKRCEQTYPRVDMDEKTRRYRLNRGLEYYDRCMAEGLEKVV